MEDYSKKDNNFSIRNAIFLSLGVGLLSAGLSIFFQARSATFAGTQDASKPVASAVAASTTASTGLGVSSNAPSNLPVRLIIPSIGVNANIQDVGLFWNGDGDMSIPTNFTDVAWYQNGPRPGQVGSAVIDGHLDGAHVPKAVFYYLGDLNVGDIVEVVDKDGTILKFKVTGSRLFDYAASTTSVFAGSTTTAQLNLITCAGDWIPGKDIYTERIVVYTTLVGSTTTAS